MIRGLTNGVNHSFLFAKCKITPDKNNIKAKTTKGKVFECNWKFETENAVRLLERYFSNPVLPVWAVGKNDIFGTN
jgi:hypothetical protein